MNGRKERDKKFENNTQKLLNKAPQYIIDYSYNFENKTARTKNAYIKYIMEFNNYFNGRDLTKLKKSDINIYLNSIKQKRRCLDSEISSSLQNAKLSAIKDFYRFLFENGDISVNPAGNIKPPKPSDQKDIVAMNPDEVKKLKFNISTGIGTQRSINRQKFWKNRDMAIITLGCSTGLRCSSIVEINVGDIDLVEKTISVTEKGNKKRTIHIGNETVSSIKRWMGDRNSMTGINTDALFISNRKSRITPGSIANIVSKYSFGINKHITPHKMRSTCATNLYEKTNDIYLVQAVLGHKNIANTKRYASVSTDRLVKAAEIMDSI